MNAFIHVKTTVIALLVLAVFFGHQADAQIKPASKPALAKANLPGASTTTTVPATTSSTKPVVAGGTKPVLDQVVKNQMKIVTLHDHAAFKSTPKYATRKAKYEKNEDGSGMQKDVPYRDKSVLHLKMVKNPSFGGQSTNISAKAKLKSKDNKKQNGSEWVCATNDVTLTATSTTFLNNDYSGTASHIYPGAIYTFENFYNGSYKEQAGARNPISLVIDNADASGSSYITVSNPWMGTMNDGVRKLTKELPAKNQGAESFAYQVYETGSSALQSLQVSGGASGYGISASASYGTSGVSNTINITIDATKIMYTINVYPPDSGYFKSESDERAANQMIIGSVSYGVRVLANLTYTFNSASEAADFKASYSGWGVSANVGLDQVSKNSNVSSTINCYVVGGPGNSTISFDKKDLEKQLKAIFAGATYQNAMPISYEFYDMAGDLIGSNSAADDQNVQSCVPNTTGGKLQSVYATWTTAPNSGKRGDDNYNFYLYSNDHVLGGAGKANNFNGSDNKQTDASLYEYKTNGLNVDYQGGQTNTIQLNTNPYYNNFFGPKDRPDINMDWFVEHGGLVHLHIYPNGNDTWNIQQLQLQLNFDGGVTKTVTWKNITVAQYSTEATLYFDGTFTAK
ncbi:MAG TPA: thiol-activated cytolysin family protein [Puia sp.]|jgi:hypothetical protein|nr:thiol-activated cytolysin family protein [Puia sp.]